MTLPPPGKHKGRKKRLKIDWTRRNLGALAVIIAAGIGAVSVPFMLQGSPTPAHTSPATNDNNNNNNNGNTTPTTSSGNPGHGKGPGTCDSSDSDAEPSHGHSHQPQGPKSNTGDNDDHGKGKHAGGVKDDHDSAIPRVHATNHGAVMRALHQTRTDHGLSVGLNAESDHSNHGHSHNCDTGPDDEDDD